MARRHLSGCAYIVDPPLAQLSAEGMLHVSGLVSPGCVNALSLARVE